ncbi:MAG TPA: hypothetical protein V6C97_19090 [Oculatellaceae cyanobacterium]
MGVEKVVEVAVEVAETASPGIGERVLAEAGKLIPAVGKLLGKGEVAEAAAKAVQPVPELIQKPEVTASLLHGIGDGLKKAYPPVEIGSKIGASSLSISERTVPYYPVEGSALSRMPRPLSSEEEEAHIERLMRALDDTRVGIPPKELTNAGVGARLWQFGTAGGDVLRERTASEVTGRWAPELQRSRQWLQENAPDLGKFPTLTEKDPGGPVQRVEQGMSTQFAASSVEVGLRTDNVATCTAIYCNDGVKHFLGHADNMVHHMALSEALETAGFDLDNTEVTLLPGPTPSPVLETVLPAFMDSPEAMSKLRIVPFKGPSNGAVVARNGKLFVP